VDGAANTELIRFLSDFFRVPSSRIVIVSGATGRSKRVQVTGVSEAEAAGLVGPVLQ